MFEKFRNRYIAAAVAVVTAFVVLIGYYYYFMKNQSNSTEDEDGNLSLATEIDDENKGVISVEGDRGSILDINGTTLAYNELSYDLEFTYDVSSSASSDKAHYTDIFEKTIQIVEDHGGSIQLEFFILKDDEGNYSYDTEGLSEDNAESRIENWIENMAIDVEKGQEITPEEAYYQLRARYRIPEDMSYEDSYKILSIWQEVQLGMYQSFVPITIAQDIDYNTVLEIETLADELVGMKISQSSSRVYPYGETACHILGYEGKITADDDVDQLKEKGYNVDSDNVGKTGVEATMEEYLTGCSKDKKGSIEVLLDKSNKVVEELGYTAPEGGDDVMLTIDFKMNQVLEQALEQNIKDVNAKQQKLYNDNKEEYDEMASTREDGKIALCESGAAIVMEVDTARVLALASYPGYDLNLFVGGIEDEAYQQLLEAKGSPLFNNAVSSASVPGSIYKMITAIAGLEEGAITLSERIDDKGPYTKYVQYGRAPGCSVSDVSRHSNQTVVEGLKNSCNYYFYTVADRLGIEKINEWADKFGVTSKTGIELTGEVAGRVGSQKTIYDNTKGINDQISYLPKLVYNQIKNYLKKCGQDRDVEYTDDQLSKATEEIIKLAGSNDAEGYSQYGPEIREIMLRELDIPTNISSSKGWSSEINIMLTQLIWNPTDTVTQGIGVTPIQITPIEVVRYIAALGNGGKILTPHIIDSVIGSDGEIVYETKTDVVEDLNIEQSYLDAVKKGMYEVVNASDGTAHDSFKSFKYAEKIAGKTGTGQVSDIDLENNGWFVCLAPYDDPEIALVVFLNHGYSGSSATQAAKDFLEYYFELDENDNAQNTPSEGSLLTD